MLTERKTMQVFKRIIYFILVIIIYCLVSFLNYHIFNFGLELFTFNHHFKLIMVVIELLLINPIITYFICEKFPYEVKAEEHNDVFLDE